MKQYVTSTLAAFLFLCLVFGTTFGAIKIGIESGWPPLLAAGIRFTIAGVIVIVFALLRGERVTLRLATVSEILLIGVTVTAWNFSTFYLAECVMPSALAALLAASTPLFAFLMAVLKKQRRLSLSAAIGLSLGTIGVGCITGAGGFEHSHVIMVAAVAILIAELIYAWGLSRARDASQRIPTILLAGGQQLAGGLVMLFCSIVFEHRGMSVLQPNGLIALVYLIFVASVFAHSISIWLATVTDATFASSWCYVSPFIALIFGAIILHESLGPAAWIGGTSVAFGAYVLNKDVKQGKRILPIEIV